MKTIIASLCLLLLACPAWAQETDEESFENGVRNFGYVSGLAHQCSPDAEKIAVERQVIKAYNGLVALFGSDQAFFYAAAFGAGTSAQYEKKKCKKYVETFHEHMKRAKTDK